MRGKETYIQVNAGFDRITPAYAGKRYEDIFGNPRQWDHPRLCGEKLRPDSFSGDVRGSPPPMRGKVSDISDRIKNIRITPAYAGKSIAVDGSLQYLRDHPRLCGEKRRNINNL